MKCWHCNSEMIWGNDFDYEDYGIEEEGIVSEFSCSNCNCTATFYCPIDNITQQQLSAESKDSTLPLATSDNCERCTQYIFQVD